MRPAYVRVELGDPDDVQAPSFVVSPVPFVWHYGDILIPNKAEQIKARSYAELCSILAKYFSVHDTLLPPEKYFKPTCAEKLQESRNVYRTVPEGIGEPEWRMEARQGIIALLEDDDTLFEKSQVSINDHICYSLEELQEELEAVAEQAGGRKKIKGEAYQPDYDVLVKEILEGYSTLLSYVDLPKSRRRSK
jgi:hypothetical protein